MLKSLSMSIAVIGAVSSLTFTTACDVEGPQGRELGEDVREGGTEPGLKPPAWYGWVMVAEAANIPDDSYRFSCGAAVIAPRWVLTHATCVGQANADNTISEWAVGVRVSSDPFSGELSHGTAIRQRFKESAFGADALALVHLDEPIEVETNLKPTLSHPLLPSDGDLVGDVATIVEWLPVVPGSTEGDVQTRSFSVMAKDIAEPFYFTDDFEPRPELLGTLYDGDEHLAAIDVALLDVEPEAPLPAGYHYARPARRSPLVIDGQLLGFFDSSAAGPSLFQRLSTKDLEWITSVMSEAPFE